MTTESMCIKLDSAYSEYVIRSAASWTFSALNNFPEISNKSGEWCLVFKEPISSQMKSKFELVSKNKSLRNYFFCGILLDWMLKCRRILELGDNIG